MLTRPLAVVAAALLAAGQPAPATRQGARTAPPAAAAPPPAARLYALDCGRIRIHDMAPFADTGEHAGEAADLVSPCFLIRHPAGDLLWEAGLGDRIAAMPDGLALGDFARFRVPVTLASQLTQLGVAPAAVRYVGFSHLHADHVGNAALFPAATWLVSRAELAAARATPAPPAVDASAFQAHDSARTVLLDGDHDVFGDGSVRILRAPGHTPGHQMLLVRLARSGPVLLAGDLYHTRENYRKGLVPALNADRAATLASFDRVARLVRNTGARLVLEHVPEDFRALPALPRYLD